MKKEVTEKKEKIGEKKLPGIKPMLLICHSYVATFVCVFIIMSMVVSLPAYCACAIEPWKTKITHLGLLHSPLLRVATIN